MSILEVDLTPNLDTIIRSEAKRIGLTPSEYVRRSMEDLLKSKQLEERPKRSIMELHGLGAEIWKDKNGNLIDAQEYVNDLRKEWDHRP